MKKPADPVVTKGTSAVLYKCFGKSEKYYFRWKDLGCWYQSALFFSSKEMAIDSIKRIGFASYFDHEENKEIVVTPLTAPLQAVLD